MRKTMLLLLVMSGLLLTFTTSCNTKKITNEESEEGVDNAMKIAIQEKNNQIIFQLNNSNAAKTLYDQLPMTIEVNNYSDNEKIFYPHEKLNITDTPMAKGPSGTLAYYEPWGNVVMYYGDCGGASGLYALGDAISGIDQIEQLSGEIKIIQYIETTKQDEKENLENQMDEEEIQERDSMFQILITIEDQIFTASLYDNDTVKSFIDQLPLTLDMKDLHGNEKYNYFTNGFPTAPQRVSEVHLGDIKLFGADCLVLFYKDFTTSYSYTSLGKVNDPQGLAEALGNGDVKVQFDRK